MVRSTRDDADLWCLGFMNGGLSMKTSIVIGGYQMEDNLYSSILNQPDLDSPPLFCSREPLVTDDPWNKHCVLFCDYFESLTIRL
ncbi:hypothetical protein CFP56_019740 [Quercus suber]|uniref:Xylanase inhibitor C-terminal domain-containing protein n=1 Tax=Quercus suber TaxID=58331 RepID=A0AAW0M0B0_QUESU